MDNLRGLIGIRRMDRVVNVWIRVMRGGKRVERNYSLMAWSY